MNPATIIFVSGLGRCGTSMVMQMLDAGGMPCVGQFPAYEPKEAMVYVRGGGFTRDWLGQNAGKAIKRIDPQRLAVPDGIAYATIWLDRDRKQQLLSQLKLLATTGTRINVPITRNVRRDGEKLLKRDRSRAMAAVNSSILFMSFERILAWPLDMASLIAETVHKECGIELDERAMAGEVIRRTPECKPDMSIEHALIEQSQAEALQEMERHGLPSD